MDKQINLKSDDRHESKRGGAETFMRKLAVPLLLTIALVLACVWGVQQSAMAAEFRNTTENMYERSFMELSETMTNLDQALSKLLVSASSRESVLLLDDVWRESGAAASLLSQIPASHLDQHELNSFIVRVGDYARAMTERVLRGEAISAQEREKLVELHTACANIASDLAYRVETGDIPLMVITADEYYQTLGGGTEESGENAAGENAAGENANGENADETEPDTDEAEKDEESIAEFPTLIYDGPYSESAEKLEPQGLTGNDITEGEAVEKARAFTGADKLALNGLVESEIAFYDITFTLPDGRQGDIAITKRGGRTLYMMTSATTNNEGAAGAEEWARLKRTGEKYLMDTGYGEAEASYAQYYSGAALVNFVAVQDGVLLYNDLVKLWIDRATHEVIGVDARNYFYSHKQREIEKPKLSAEEAKKKVSPSLVIGSEALALIPLDVKTECLCYEFKGRLGEGENAEEYIVYINASTGEEEEIFKIIDSQNGQLVV